MQHMTQSTQAAGDYVLCAAAPNEKEVLMAYSVNDAIFHCFIRIKVFRSADGLLDFLGLMICMLTQQPYLQAVQC